MDRISHAHLRQLVRPFVLRGASEADLLSGFAAALVAPEARTLPVSASIDEEGVFYAWKVDDGDVLKFVCSVVGKLAATWFAGPLQPAAVAGVVFYTVPETVFFLTKLARNQVRLEDPACIAVLLALRHAPDSPGWTAEQVWRRVQASVREGAPSNVEEVDAALRRLLTFAAKAGPKPLVHQDGPWWRSLV